jgi:heme-degrading monooxygenase HmoA
MGGCPGRIDNRASRPIEPLAPGLSAPRPRARPTGNDVTPIRRLHRGPPRARPSRPAATPNSAPAPTGMLGSASIRPIRSSRTWRVVAMSAIVVNRIKLRVPVEEVAPAVEREVLPVLQGLPGFERFSLVQAGSNEVVVIISWSSVEAAGAGRRSWVPGSSTRSSLPMQRARIGSWGRYWSRFGRTRNTEPAAARQRIAPGLRRPRGARGNRPRAVGPRWSHNVLSENA